MKIIEGDFATPKGRFAIVAGRFNAFVVEPLVQGARDTLVRHGVKDDAIDLIRVPGAWEIAQAAYKVAGSGNYAAVLGLGAVIQGAPRRTSTTSPAKPPRASARPPMPRACPCALAC